MTTSAGQRGRGVGAARALLGILEEYSAEDFHAADEYLSGPLAKIARQLGDLKGRPSIRSGGTVHQTESAAAVVARSFHYYPGMLSVELLRELVRALLVRMPLARQDVMHAASLALYNSRAPEEVIKGATVEDVVESAFFAIEQTYAPERERIDALARLLKSCAEMAGPRFIVQASDALQHLAAQALEQNVLVFPTLHALSQVPTRWGAKPLQVEPNQPRVHVVEAIFRQLERREPEARWDTTLELLKDGLQGPADAGLNMLRQRKATKARGE